MRLCLVNVWFLAVSSARVRILENKNVIEAVFLFLWQDWISQVQLGQRRADSSLRPRTILASPVFGLKSVYLTAAGHPRGLSARSWVRYYFTAEMHIKRFFRRQPKASLEAGFVREGLHPLVVLTFRSLAFTIRFSRPTDGSMESTRGRFVVEIPTLIEFVNSIESLMTIKSMLLTVARKSRVIYQI